MADNKKYYYMRLKENFFDTDELKILESMDDGYLYSNILIKLYLKSLKYEGRLLFKDTIPYNSKMIATITNHHIGVVEKALVTFSELGLITILDGNVMYMNEIELLVGKTSTEGDRKRAVRKQIESGEFKGLIETKKEDGQMSDKCPPEIRVKSLELELENKDIKETSAKPPSASKVKYEESNPYYQLANYLYQSILRNDPKAKQPNMQTWSNEIRKLVELDNRDILEVKDVITFATNDSFWKTNILSTKKLREKFTALYMKSVESPKSCGQKKYQAPTPQAPSNQFNYENAEDWGNR